MKKLLFLTFFFITFFSVGQQLDGFVQEGQKNVSQSISGIAAYPNPLVVDTKISFQTTKSQVIDFTVKNLLGKTVYMERINAKQGTNAFIFRRNNLAKGMYIYTLQTDNEIVSKRLVIR